MDSNTELCLTGVSYSAEKRRISAEFSNRKERETRAHGFFPCMFVPHMPMWRIESALSYAADKRHFRIEPMERSIKVTASTASELSSFCSGLKNTSGVELHVIEPERQFLLQKGWSYFDCFFLGAQQEERTECSKPFGAVLDAFALPLDEVLARLKSQRKEMLAVMEKTVLSNLLCIPVHLVPGTIQQCAEIFVENALFMGEVPAANTAHAANPQNKERHSCAAEASASDALIAAGLSLNIGLDTMDCRCCKPRSIHESNISPNTTAIVRFEADGTFIDSKSKGWAQLYHARSPGSEDRIARQREWCLSVIPAGPFHRNEKAEIPLIDALKAESEGIAKIQGIGSSITWFCTRSESALQHSITHLLERAILARCENTDAERSEFARSNLLALEVLNSDISYVFREVTAAKAVELLRSVYSPLTTNGSRLFCEGISAALEAIALALRDANPEGYMPSQPLAALGRGIPKTNSAIAAMPALTAFAAEFRSSTTAD